MDTRRGMDTRGGSVVSKAGNNFINWNTTAAMINMYRSNNTAKLTPEQIACLNLVRDLFLQAEPLPVSVTKRFETDEELINYYKNLEKKYGGATQLSGGTHGIFDKSFVISPIMKAYADKFYKRRLNVAASHLSDVVKYQMANAVTHSKPLPIVHNDVADEYLNTLKHRSPIAPNVEKLVADRSNQRLNVCNDVFNNLVEDVLFGSHNGYFINSILKNDLKEKVYKFRDNIAYLVNAPLTLSTNVYMLIEKAAINAGHHAADEKMYEEIVSNTAHRTTPIQESLTELAFENEALRRGLIQDLNIKYKNLS
uniref:Gp41 n=1 Tax=Agrotis segetum granulosis virus TaxID=10464 RepID=A0A023MI82_GVAS|nr:gp41 [Agrotis segetum granulovirus]